jgi:hypothetical protein
MYSVQSFPYSASNTLALFIQISDSDQVLVDLCKSMN